MGAVCGLALETGTAPCFALAAKCCILMSTPEPSSAHSVNVCSSGLLPPLSELPAQCK